VCVCGGGGGGAVCVVTSIRKGIAPFRKEGGQRSRTDQPGAERAGPRKSPASTAHGLSVGKPVGTIHAHGTIARLQKPSAWSELESLNPKQ
jgi:hypothetical protein